MTALVASPVSSARQLEQYQPWRRSAWELAPLPAFHQRTELIGARRRRRQRAERLNHCSVSDGIEWKLAALCCMDLVLMSLPSTPRSSKLGRPRAFDLDAALDRAVEVFWQKGYEGASLTDLTDAMGINRPSLYAAFGNKEALFCRALDRYASGPAAYTCEALEAPTAYEVVRQLLAGAIRVTTGPTTPAGCMMVQSALVSGDGAGAMRQEVAARRANGLIRLRERLERARAEGDLPADSDPALLASYIFTVQQGMSVQAASGATREELERIAELALRVWPSKGTRAQG